MKNGKDGEKNNIKEIIEAAVNASYEILTKGIESKLQEAINIGATLGAATGAKAGAAAAIKTLEDERRRQKRKQYDKRLYNTKLLLRHYRTLNEHYKHGIYTTNEGMFLDEALDESFSDIMEDIGMSGDESLCIESIKRSCTRTKIIMSHVNKMLEIYEIMCKRSKRQDDARHWRVLQALYLAENATPASKVAAAEHIDRRTVYKDIDMCVTDLTALLFGIEGVEKQ